MFYSVPIYCKIDYLFFTFIAETNTKQPEKSQSKRITKQQAKQKNKTHLNLLFLRDIRNEFRYDERYECR